MTKNQPIPWLRIGAESVAIVASILLAFGIDAWWDWRSSREQAELWLTALEREWLAELEKIDFTLEDAKTVDVTVDTILNVYRRVGPEPPPDVLNSILRGEGSLRVYKPSTGALDNILLSGDLDNIPDDLRIAIASWPSVLDEIAPEGSAILETYLLEMLSAIGDVATSDVYSAQDVATESQSNDLAAIVFRDERYASAAFHYRILILTYVDQLQDVRDQLTQNIELLQARWK